MIGSTLGGISDMQVSQQVKRFVIGCTSFALYWSGNAAGPRLWSLREGVNVFPYLNKNEHWVAQYGLNVKKGSISFVTLC